jgi:peptidoglycan/xylan/chitin deacetylase (PgdA/CDA1 family)
MNTNQPTVCITFDFDAFSLWLGPALDLSSPTMMSRGEFGGRVGAPRILDFLEREGIPASFYVPGHTAESFPDVCRRILEDGHEIGHHGYLHESPVHLTLEQEREMYERGFEALDRVVGTRPTGYRSPAWDLSPNSIDLQLEFGFDYDSSMMADDFRIYRVRQGDVPHKDRGYEFGTEVDLVEFPVSWTLDDFPQMEYNITPMLPGLHGHEKTLAMWRNDFDFMCEEVPDGVFGITFHPQVIGRGSRFRILTQLVAHMQERGARFVRVDQAVSEWRAAHPFESATTAG